MQLTRMRGAVVVLAGALVSVAFPAMASTPSQVGVVSFVGDSPTSLTLSWPRVSGATSYQVFRSGSTTMSSPSQVATPTSSRVTVSGLSRGTTYCFQVRAMSGSQAGMRSARTCKPTIVTQPSVSGPSYAVMTFNACSEVCGGWAGTRLAASRKLIAARAPDLIALQEAGAFTTPPSGYSEAVYKSAKRIFYKTSRFYVASGSQGRRVGYDEMSSGKYAVWAELVDRVNGRHLIFVSVHTAPAFVDYPLRGREIQHLLQHMSAVNPGRLPVLYAGDFNSHKNRGTYDPSTGRGVQDTVGDAFAAAGYVDAYDLADSLKRPNWNSYAGFTSTPTMGKTWGDHVDHVYVVPRRTHVVRWMNSALYSGDHYRAPYPSDHTSVMADLTLS